MTQRTPIGDGVLHDEPLAKYTAARLGGPADMLYIARQSTEMLAAVVLAAWADGVPVRLLGGGANVLISDKGVRGLVVVNAVSGLDFRDDGTVVAESGVSLTTLARRCLRQNLTGFEWAVSVPGTVGGAVVNNAGAHGSNLQANLREISLLEYGHDSPRTVPADDLHYDYRTSALKHREDRRFLVLSALLGFEHAEHADIQARMDANIAHRKRTQPPGASLGSIFKNPPGDYAGRLIELAGLKGHSIGGAQVSPVHANFFINTGGATAQDYYALIVRVHEKVQQETGVSLELEVELIGEW